MITPILLSTIPLLLGSLLTFVITRKYIMKVYNTTIKYKNGVIDSYITENKALRKQLNLPGE